MSAVNPNPFTPPRADVADVHLADGYSQPRVWAVKGRLGRLRYLAYITVATLAMYAVMGVGGATLALSGSTSAFYVLMGLAYIPYLVLAIMLAIQRSHDMDWSGWSVLATLIPLAGFIWVFKAGTPGANRFGNPPPPNPLSVKILGLLVPIIGVIGIVAAVALPAYQGYTMRAKAKQAQLQQQAPAQQQQQ